MMLIISDQLVNFISMSSKQNATHSRKLSNTIELKSRYSTLDEPRLSQTFKLPALNAINKSVKYNDLSFATSRDMRKLRKEPEASDDFTEIAAHSIMLGIRKKYDHIMKVRDEQEHEIESLEIERERFRIERDQYVDEKKEAEKKVAHLQQSLQNIKIQGEESDTVKKVMLHVSQRMKSDKLFYGEKKVNLEKELHHLSKTKEIIVRENTSNHEEEDNTKKVYNKLVEHFEQEQREREESIASLERMIEEKNSLLDYTTMRSVEMKEIAQSALQDKDGKEKNWYKVYLCHKFVEKFLKDKMQREMIKFGTVETAFKNIKTETGVEGTQSLVSKFLNKQHIYGDLLGKIASNEKEIEDLKVVHEQLTKERTKLKAQRSDLNFSKNQIDLSEEEKEYIAISQRSTICELFYDKLRAWLLKNRKKMGKMQRKESIEAKESIEPSQVVSDLKKYIIDLERNLTALKDIQVSSNETGELVLAKSNFRIPKKTEQQIADAKVDTKQQDEDEFVNYLREQLHRDNSRFMKELKKKYEQIKKTRFEGEAKKKEPSPQKPKAPAQ